jgi:hypothetical protein
MKIYKNKKDPLAAKLERIGNKKWSIRERNEFKKPVVPD